MTSRRSRSSALATATSRERPTNVVAGCGRLFGTSTAGTGSATADGVAAGGPSTAALTAASTRIDDPVPADSAASRSTHIAAASA